MNRSEAINWCREHITRWPITTRSLAPDGWAWRVQNLPYCEAEFFLTNQERDIVFEEDVIKDYQLIYADPPWSYNNKASNGAADNHYATLTMDQLKAMGPDIQTMSAQDAVLALWVVSPMLPDCLEVMASWGFEYKTLLFNWVKLTKTGKSAFGGGNYTRAGSELCLLGVRGKGVKRVNNSIRQVVTSRLREHSRKPAEVRDNLEVLFGDVRRIELFARSEHEGWDNYGNEVGKFNDAQKLSEMNLDFLE